MEKKVLIEKYKEKPILYKVLIEKIIDRKIFYVYGYFDTRKPGEYIYFDDRIKLELKFNYEPFYIGKGCGDRMFNHLSPSSLKENSHKNNKIKKIIKETGEIPIISMLQSGMTEQNALALERKFVALIGRKDLKKGPLTNLTDAGDGGGSNLSQETRDKISISRKGKYLGEDNPNYGKHLSDESKEKIGFANSGLLIDKMISKYGKEVGERITKEIGEKRGSYHKKTILQYSLDGDFIIEHVGIEDTSVKLNISNSSISDCINGVIRYGGGFIWRLKEEESFPQKIEGIKNHRKKIPVLQYSLNGEFIENWDSIFSAALYLNNNIRNQQLKNYSTKISNSCKGRYSKGCGFVWKYYDQNLVIEQKIITNILTVPKRVIQYDLNMNELNRFNSLTEAHKITKAPLSSICMVCSGNKKTAGGFIWRYADKILSFTL